MADRPLGDPQLTQASERVLVAGKPLAQVAPLDKSIGGNSAVLQMGENAGNTGVEETGNFTIADLGVGGWVVS